MIGQLFRSLHIARCPAQWYNKTADSQHNTRGGIPMRKRNIGLCCLCCIALAGSPGGVPLPGASSAYAAESAGISLSAETMQIGQPVRAELHGISAENVSYVWTVGGETASASGSSYTPTADDCEKMITVTASAGDAEYSASVYFSQLPVVYISTEEEITSKTEYISGTLHIQGNAEFSDPAQLYSGAVQIRGRGNYTWEHDKKPYKIKLDSKADLFGMGANKHWVLLAEYKDPTHLRNEIMPELSETLGFAYTAESEAVAVVLNGEYNGLYHLGENVRVDTNRVNIYDWEETAEDIAKAVYKNQKASGMTKDDRDALETQLTEDLSWVTSGSFTWNNTVYQVSDFVTLPDGIAGGYLLELDTYDEYHLKQVSDFDTDGKQPVQFKSPEYAVTNPEMYQYAKDCIQSFENAVRADDYYAEYDGRPQHYSELFDMDSLVRYWLMLELSANCDGMRYSNFMYQDFGQKFHMGPAWDYDWTWNASYVVPTDEWWTDQYYYNMTAHWYKYLVRDPYFITRAYELYQAHRAEFAEIYADGGAIGTYAEKLAVPAKADLAKWHETWDYDDEIEKTKTYVTERFQWLDAQFADPETLAASLGYTASEQLSAADISSDGSSVKLSARVGSSAAASVTFHINGMYAGEAAVQNGTASLTVGCGMLTADKLNTVQIRMKNAAGDYLAAEKTDNPNPWGHGGWDPWGMAEPEDVGSLVYSAFRTFSLSELGLSAAVRGDVSADGVCDHADAVLLQKYLLTEVSVLPDWRAGDLDGNGELNAGDLTLLKRLLLH